jgi:hypothetical protein
LDTDGNIFGGFTPTEWDSVSGRKADPSLKSFLFTLKNPHNVPPRRFPLMAEESARAIFCSEEKGPGFHDILISDNCNSSADSYGYFDGCVDTYSNDTQRGKQTYFGRSDCFQVKEIEVFEITI